MPINEDICSDMLVPTAYAPGCVHISGQPFNHSIILARNRLITWSAKSLEHICAADIAQLTHLIQADSIVIVGLGDEPAPIRPDWGPYDFMTNANACRSAIALSNTHPSLILALIISPKQ